ncbi:MAG: S8 family serine peptidase [Thermoplasmatota archaeon]
MRLLLVALLLAISGLAASLPAAPAVEEPARFLVDVDGLRPPVAEALLAASGADVVRVDPRLGFAVVTAPSSAWTGGLLAGRLTADARGAEASTGEDPNDPLFGQQWAMDYMEMTSVWARQGGDRSILVAVVDSGIERDHQDLAGAHILLGTDYVDGGDPDDERGHGTHVAGIIAAERNNEEGVAGMAAVTLYVTRVLDRSGHGWCSDYASGIAEAADADARIINFSAFCPIDLPALRHAVAYADAAGALVVSVSGTIDKTDPSACKRSYPGVYPEVVAVGALTPLVTRAMPASYSCFGSHLELLAPGSYIKSTERGFYFERHGTSMAAAHVSGVAALLFSEQPDLSANEVRTLLQETARGLPRLPLAHLLVGHGIVDPVAALDALPEAP